MSDFFSMYCPECGNKIKETDSLCPHCGINLDEPLDEASLREGAEESMQEAKKAYKTGSKAKAALRYIYQALDYQPDSAEAHNLLGLILDDLGRTKEAFQAYREAVRLDPNLPEARANYENAKKELDEEVKNFLDQAEEAYENQADVILALSYVAMALELQPDSAEALNYRGLILDETGKTREAIQDYRKAVQLDPNLADARNNLEEALADVQGDDAVQTEAFDKNVLEGDALSWTAPDEALPAVAPTAKEYLQEAIETYEDGSQPEAALAYINMAIEREPGLAEAHNYRGLILDDLDRPEEAMPAYREAIRLDPTFSEARQNLNDAMQEKIEAERHEGAVKNAWHVVLIVLVFALLAAAGYLAWKWLTM